MSKIENKSVVVCWGLAIVATPIMAKTWIDGGFFSKILFWDCCCMWVCRGC